MDSMEKRQLEKENIEIVCILLCLLIFSRIAKQTSSCRYSLNFVTIYSNTLSLFAILSMLYKNNKKLLASASNIAFSMMIAFWTVYISCGEKALYGRHDPTDFEIWADHFIIPLSTIFISIIKQSHCSCIQDMKYTILLSFGWFVYTLVTGPAYPFLRQKKTKSTKYNIMVPLFMAFVILSVIFEYVNFKIFEQVQKKTIDYEKAKKKNQSSKEK
tara:strand:- start:494 stop:1138 length:645 start_codon:yes stop_codon:yes gene_type:complete